MLEADPDKIRAVIDGMRGVDPKELGDALAYFGRGAELSGAEEIIGDLVVALIEYAKSEEGMPLSIGLAEYTVSLNKAYEAKANEL